MERKKWICVRCLKAKFQLTGLYSELVNPVVQMQPSLSAYTGWRAVAWHLLEGLVLTSSRKKNTVHLSSLASPKPTLTHILNEVSSPSRSDYPIVSNLEGEFKSRCELLMVLSWASYWTSPHIYIENFIKRSTKVQCDIGYDNCQVKCS